ncbi:MAG: hypothetical protein Q7S16_03645 [bacterium]|nr:hypothetical protein [bacterium]
MILTFLRKRSTTIGLLLGILFGLFPMIATMATAKTKSSWAGPPVVDKNLKTKIKRVDTKSSARFVNAKDEIIVQFKKNTIDVKNKDGVEKARTFAAKKSMTVKSFLQSMNAIVVQSIKKETVEAAMKRLRTDPAVKLVQKNFQTALKNNPKSK